MKLVNMKIDPAEREKRYADTVVADRPLYPYGLSINLEQDALEKLGLVDALPEVGKPLTLTARVDVTSVSENDSADGGKRCSLSLQITDLALGPAKDDEDAADKLYAKAAAK